MLRTGSGKKKKGRGGTRRASPVRSRKLLFVKRCGLKMARRGISLFTVLRKGGRLGVGGGGCGGGGGGGGRWA